MIRMPCDSSSRADQLLERAVALDRDPGQPRAVLHDRDVLGQGAARPRPVQREGAEHLAGRALIGIDQQ
jgi:hypothetical protein